jgi:hypothetical protein
MTTFSSSAKPLPFYADGEAPLEVLVDKWGSHLERMTRYEKFILLGSSRLNLLLRMGNPWIGITERHHRCTLLLISSRCESMMTLWH